MTDSRDLDEARDVLDRIISVDRADVPATTQRRELVAADRAPRRTQPRCELPDWLPELRTEIAQQLADNERRYIEQQAELRSLRGQLQQPNTSKPEPSVASIPISRDSTPHTPRTELCRSPAWSIYGRSQHLKGRRRRAADREPASGAR